LPAKTLYAVPPLAICKWSQIEKTPQKISHGGAENTKEEAVALLIWYHRSTGATDGNDVRHVKIVNDTPEPPCSLYDPTGSVPCKARHTWTKQNVIVL